MRVYNLACERDHTFEGWFGSAEEFDRQRQKNLLRCPLCDSENIEKRLHAPAVVSARALAPREDKTAPAALEKTPEVMLESLRGILNDANTPQDVKLQAVRDAMRAHVNATTEDVGENFAQEARAMYYDEKPARGIRGKASAQETMALLDEGIEVLPLPFALEPTDLH